MERRRAGGIISLARLIDKHESAIEYDLLTRAGMSLEDVPARLSWHSLACFVRHLDANSALYADMYPKHAGWDYERAMLADIFDAINGVAYTVACGMGAKPRKPKKYPRPKAARGVKFGSDPIKVADFDTWWNARVNHG